MSAVLSLGLPETLRPADQRSNVYATTAQVESSAANARDSTLIIQQAGSLAFASAPPILKVFKNIQTLDRAPNVLESDMAAKKPYELSASFGVIAAVIGIPVAITIGICAFLANDISGVRSDMKTDLAEIRGDAKADITEIRGDIKDLTAVVHSDLLDMTKQIVATNTKLDDLITATKERNTGAVKRP
jgi:hypothetical protein